MTPEETKFADIIENLVEQWGFRRYLGRIWSLLYLRPQPLTPSQLQQELDVSIGSVSGALTELLQWGVIKKTRIAGERSHYYEVETHIWKSMCNVLRAREQRILEEASSGLQELRAKPNKKNTTKATRDFQQTRIANIHTFLQLTEQLADAVTKTGKINPAKVGMLIHKIQKI